MLVGGNQQFRCYSGRVACSEDRGNRLLRSPGLCLPNSTASHAKQILMTFPCNTFRQFVAFSTCMFCKLGIILWFNVYLVDFDSPDLLTVPCVVLCCVVLCI